MGLISRLFGRGRRQQSLRAGVESAPTTLSTWANLMDSKVLSGPVSTASERVSNTTLFMDSLQGLILAKAQLERDEAETRNASALTSMLPHVRYSARLHHDGLQWICSWGTDPQSQLVGRGACPSEALENFDLAWYGETRGGNDKNGS